MRRQWVPDFLFPLPPEKEKGSLGTRLAVSLSWSSACVVPQHSTEQPPAAKKLNDYDLYAHIDTRLSHYRFGQHIGESMVKSLHEHVRLRIVGGCIDPGNAKVLGEPQEEFGQKDRPLSDI